MTRLCALLLLVLPAAAQDILVLTPDDFAPALAAWRKHREAQGHAIVVRAPGDDPAAVVREVAGNGALKFVLVVGDVKQVPTGTFKAEIIADFGEDDPNVAHDNHLADLDGDDLPDLAVGRIPADHPKEAELMLGKVVAYETSTDFSPWRRRVNILAGVGGFGAAADAALEMATTHFLKASVPASLDLHVTYCNPNSPFCPPPGSMGKLVLERFNEGALIVAYMGHGSRLRLDRMIFNRRVYDIFDDEAVYSLEARHGPPIVFFCACSTGHVDGAPDSLAEVAMKQPKGPIAVIASSRVSMPYANGVLSKELLDALFGDRAATLGEALALAKRRTVNPRPDDRNRLLIEQMAVFWSTPEKRAKEKREHVFLYNLSGDPALRIPRPAEATLEVAEEAALGGRLKVAGTSPVSGEAIVELVMERTPLVPRRAGDSDKEFAECYENANRWAKARTAASGARRCRSTSTARALSGLMYNNRTPSV